MSVVKESNYWLYFAVFLNRGEGRLEKNKIEKSVKRVRYSFNEIEAPQVAVRTSVFYRARFQYQAVEMRHLHRQN